MHKLPHKFAQKFTKIKAKTISNSLLLNFDNTDLLLQRDGICRDYDWVGPGHPRLSHRGACEQDQRRICLSEQVYTYNGKNKIMKEIASKKG